MFFNDFINNRRKELNISIDELVIKSGIPKGTLSKITAGISTNPTLSTVEALCSALNCSLDDAVGYIERNKNNITFSNLEIDIINKYRTLDDFGKKAVDDILNNEYERCTYTEKIPVVVAARSSENRPVEVTYISKEKLEQIQNEKSVEDEVDL